MRRTWQRALVTGASSGIGEALARRLAAGGADLVLVARNRERLEHLADQLSDRHGIDAEVLTADLADRDQLATVEARVADETEPVELVVNNAGFGYSGLFGEIPVEDEDAEIQVNIVALMRLSHAAITRMRGDGSARRPRGGILLISSIASFEPLPRTANYAATKAYVTSFGQALHEEARRDGITVTTVCPGLTRTEFQSRGGDDQSDIPELFWQTADQVATEALAGIDRGRALVTTGLINKSAQIGTWLLPQPVARRTIAEVAMRRRR
jgi:uncharacterized protein